MTITTIRVDYHGDPSNLIADGILGVIPRLSNVDVWLQMHWLRGPHILVHVSGESTAVAVAQAELVRLLTVWLAESPSQAELNEETYMALSQELGRLELVAGPYGPMRLDNSVSIVDRGFDSFIKDQALLGAKGKILARAMGDPRFVRIARRSSVQNADTAYLAMCLIAVSYPKWGLVSGYQAFLSHWKEQLNWSDPMGRAEARLGNAFARQKDHLVQQLRAVHESLSNVDEELTFWSDWCDAALEDAVDLASHGKILPYPLPERHDRAVAIDDETGRRWSGSDQRPYSDFHAQFRRLDFTKLGNGTDFAAYRYLINCFFDLLPLIGITAAQRYALAFFLSEAAQIVVGETWQQTVDRAIRKQETMANATPTLPWKG